VVKSTLFVVKFKIHERTQRSAVGAGDAATSPRKISLGKFGWIWAKLKRNLGKSDSIWAKLIRYVKNQNLASPKTFDLLRL